jgi:hypothetical protein
VVKDLKHEEPTRAMTASDATEIGSRRRGVEPLRIVVMLQRIQRVAIAPTRVIAPMPLVV